MENIKCKQCGSIAVRRMGSEFCSVKCKNKHWNSQKPKKAANTENETDDKDVINVSLVKKTDIEPPKQLMETFKTETLVYMVCRGSLKNLKQKRLDLVKAIEKNYNQVKATQSNLKNELILGGAMIGMTKGKIGMGMGALGGLLLNSWIEKNKPHEMKVLAMTLSQLDQELFNVNSLIQLKEKELKTVPQYQDLKRTIVNPAYTAYQLRKWLEQEQEQQQKAKEEAIIKKKEQEKLEQQRLTQEERQKLIIEMEGEALKEVDEVVQPQITAMQTKHRIISSKELCSMNFPTLDFSGKWYDFLGKPETNSCIVIHGRPGSGKTTFTVIFSKYLALKFGKVIIVSKEEGFGETLKLKLERLNAQIDNLSIANFISLEQIYNNIQQEDYNFIVLDSLNKLKIDADALEQLREHYSNSVIIAISQSTKDGKMRGSNEIIHDCDIEIAVTNGIATTIKNRFYQTGEEFEIFEKLDVIPTRSKVVKPLRNIV